MSVPMITRMSRDKTQETLPHGLRERKAFFVEITEQSYMLNVTVFCCFFFFFCFFFVFFVVVVVLFVWLKN